MAPVDRLKPFTLPFIGGLNLTAYLGLWWTYQRAGSLREPVTGQTVAWYLLATFGFLLALLWAEKQQQFPRRWLWGGAILFRLLLLFTTPSLSDDVYRYLWDGHLVTKGISPYQYRIDAPELDKVAVPVRDMANNRWMASPYLPVAHLLFAASAFLLPLTPLSLQIILVILDLLIALALSQLLRRLKLPPHRLLWYLWHPLLIVEVAHSAHLDVWMTLLALAGVSLALLLPRQAKLLWLSPLLLALATLTKILPIFLLPVLFWRWRWGQRFLYAGVVLFVLLLASVPAGWGLVGPLDGVGLFGALRIYADQWQFNGGIYHWLQLLLQSFLSEPDAVSLAKRVGYGVTVLVGGLVWLLAKDRPLTQTLYLLPLPLLTYLAFSATIAPWYLILLLPIAPLLTHSTAQRLIAGAILFLSLAVFYSYLIYLDGAVETLFEIIRVGEWLPTLLLLIVSLVVWLRSGRVRLTRIPAN